MDRVNLVLRKLYGKLQSSVVDEISSANGKLEAECDVKFRKLEAENRDLVLLLDEAFARVHDLEKKTNASVADKPLSLDEFKRRTKSLMEEYLSIRLVEEALECVVELKSPAYHSEFVKEAISLALEREPPCVEPVSELMAYLFEKKVVDADDIGAGCLSYAALLEDHAIDVPKAPASFGEIVGKLVLAGELDFKAVKEVVAEVDNDYFRKAVFAAVEKTVSNDSAGKRLLYAQAYAVAACESLF